MKCYACGYKNENGTNSSTWNTQKQKYDIEKQDAFIRVKNNVLVLFPNRDLYSNHASEVELVACPKCGTIKIDDYRINESSLEDQNENE